MQAQARGDLAGAHQVVDINLLPIEANLG